MALGGGVGRCGDVRLVGCVMVCMLSCYCGPVLCVLYICFTCLFKVSSTCSSIFTASEWLINNANTNATRNPLFTLIGASILACESTSQVVCSLFVVLMGLQSHFWGLCSCGLGTVFLWQHLEWNVGLWQSPSRQTSLTFQHVQPCGFGQGSSLQQHLVSFG